MTKSKDKTESIGQDGSGSFKQCHPTQGKKKKLVPIAKVSNDVKLWVELNAGRNSNSLAKIDENLVVYKIGVNRKSLAKGFRLASLQVASEVSINFRFFDPPQLYFVDYFCSPWCYMLSCDKNYYVFRGFKSQ